MSLRLASTRVNPNRVERTRDDVQWVPGDMLERFLLEAALQEIERLEQAAAEGGSQPSCEAHPQLVPWTPRRPSVQAAWSDEGSPAWLDRRMALVHQGRQSWWRRMLNFLFRPGENHADRCPL